MPTDTDTSTDTERHHYFVIRASIRDGKAHYMIDDNCVVDPDRPIWDEATQTWSRVSAEDEANDIAFAYELAEVIERLNAG